MTAQQVSQMVRDEYERIRSKIMADGISEAIIQIDVLPDSEINKPNQVCCYFPEQNKIRMVFYESEIGIDYAMAGSKDFSIEPVWKAYLRHEIIHEYQYKCVKAFSTEGQKLMKESKFRFPGDGHDEKFYTAICESAPKLGMMPEELLKSI